MSCITDIFMIETTEQKAVAIHSNVAVAEIPTVIGEGFMKLDEHVKTKNVVASGTPFLQINGTDPTSIKITIGMTVPQITQGHGTIENITIPAGKKIFCYWQGDNSDMSSLHEEMRSFAQDLGYEIQNGFFEYYLNDPKFGVDKLLTKVFMLLQWTNVFMDVYKKCQVIRFVLLNKCGRTVV